MVKLNEFHEKAWLDLKRTQDLERKAGKILEELGINSNKIAGDMRSSPYADFKPYEPEDPIDAQKKEVGDWGYGVEPESGQGYFVPLAQKNNLKKLNELMIASEPSKLWGPTANGAYLDLEEGIHGRVWQNEGGYLKRGPQYNEQLHGPPVPLAHHTGGKHFTEPSMEELIDGLINGEVPRGTLGDEETENRLIQERQNQLQHQSLMINDENIANLPYQDGRAPTRPFYNAPYTQPDLFIKDQQAIEDAKKRFKLNTGIDLARR